MQVENWTQNFTSNGYDGMKRQKATLSQRAMRRLSREATDYIGGYGLDFAQLSGPAFAFYDMLTCSATWTHKTTGQEVELTDIWFDRATGAITQAGSNYGRLSL